MKSQEVNVVKKRGRPKGSRNSKIDTQNQGHILITIDRNGQRVEWVGSMNEYTKAKKVRSLPAVHTCGHSHEESKLGFKGLRKDDFYDKYVETYSHECPACSLHQISTLQLELLVHTDPIEVVQEVSAEVIQEVEADAEVVQVEAIEVVQEVVEVETVQVEDVAEVAQEEIIEVVQEPSKRKSVIMSASEFLSDGAEDGEDLELREIEALRAIEMAEHLAMVDRVLHEGEDGGMEARYKKGSKVRAGFEEVYGEYYYENEDMAEVIDRLELYIDGTVRFADVGFEKFIGGI